VTTNRARPEGRLVVIMFDWSIRFEDQALAKRIASAAVDQLGPDDLAAVIFSSAFSNGGVPQNFTADRARLLAAINQPFAVAMHNPPKGSPFHDPRNSNEVMIDDPEGYEAGDCYCRLCVPEAPALPTPSAMCAGGGRRCCSSGPTFGCTKVSKVLRRVRGLSFVRDLAGARWCIRASVRVIYRKLAGRWSGRPHWPT
jgi:hypothetical protein